jgi:hypothetical protein
MAENSQIVSLLQIQYLDDTLVALINLDMVSKLSMPL